MASTESNTQTYKLTSLECGDINQHFQDAIDVIQQHSCNTYYNSEYTYHYETCCFVTHPSDTTTPVYDWNDMSQQSWPQVIPDVSLSQSAQNQSPHFYSILPPQKSSKGRKKLRLYEYLHEALNDPTMGDSIQWTDSGSGTFHFVSKNKEKLAECWGQRKGNRKTMTYQKMARALRNYSRTGEIMKVRRKLTYQFNPDILHRLGSVHLPVPHPRAQGGEGGEEAHGRQQSQAEQGYCGTAAVTDWHACYPGHYHQPQAEDYDLASGFTSHSITKL